MKNSNPAFRHSLRLASVLLLLASLPAVGEEPQSFTLHEVAHGVYAAVAKPGGGAGANAGFVVGEDAVAVVDTFQSPKSAEELLAAIRRTTPLPIRFVVDTHYHLDHVAGNGVFAKAGATVVAQRNVRPWERTENLKWWGDKIPPAAKAMVESLDLPDLSYDRAVDLFLGSRKLEVRTLPGHTGSDSVVVVPDANVVFTGDLFWNHTLPNTTDADTAAWILSDDRLATEHPAATFVPGHGEIGHAAELRTFRGYLEALRAQVDLARSEGRSGDALVAAVEPVLKERYGDWAFYDHFIEDNITQAAEELAGTKRRPTPP